MELKKLTETLSVSGQISIADIEQLKAAGVKSIICNRPDNEEANQLEHKLFQEAAQKHGIDYVFMPVISGQITIDNVNDFKAALASLPQPTHAYCRSGMRCTSLWGLSESSSGADKQTLLNQAATAGYDLSKLL